MKTGAALKGGQLSDLFGGPSQHCPHRYRFDPLRKLIAETWPQMQLACAPVGLRVRTIFVLECSPSPHRGQ